jgi:hypothetical protein
VIPAKPEGVSADWWDSVLRVAATSGTRDQLDARTRPLLHAVYQAYQTIEGNALSPERRALMTDLRCAVREAWYAQQAQQRQPWNGNEPAPLPGRWVPKGATA